MPPATSDFRLYHGNDLEVLAGVLARELARADPRQGMLEPVTILIPQPAMRRWLQKTLAEAHGIAANLRFLAPGEFVGEVLDANVPGTTDPAIGDAGTLRWRLWEVLADPALLGEPVFAPLHRVLAGSDPALAAWSLAGELAAAFEKYQAWRRGWLQRWDHGGDRGDWQAELWRRATRNRSHRARRIGQYLARFGVADAPAPSGVPSRVFAFAIQNISPDVLRVVASTARAGTLHFFFLSSVEGWWGDLLTARERLRDEPVAGSATSVFDDEENPLLRANGAAGRDFIRSLFGEDVVAIDSEFPIYVPPDPARRTGLLHRIQRDLLARRPPPRASLLDPLPAFEAAADGDRSLQVHSSHTRLREVQVLHEQLRDLLERDPRLQARDIAVLTPDIDLYAPHVHAVFGGRNQGVQRIPYAIGDASALATQPLADAFLRVLGLPGARFTANEVLELLSVPAIAQNLQLEAADFERLQAWLREAGARWGIDAAHREALGAPAEPAYTWAWALDRLLLGHASGDSEDILGVAPWPELEGSAVGVLDSLLQGLQKLAALQRSLAGPHPAQRWQELLAHAIDGLFAARPVEAGDRRAIDALRAQVADFGSQVRDADVSRAIPLPLVQSWFAAALAESDARQPFLTGGVTFGRMVPMRLVPFKVICLLGMNDGDFPRRDPAGGLNRLSAELGTALRQVGDRSIREDDRGLFLQLFAAAEQCLYLSYLGQDPRSGESLPPSVVVAELLDVAASYFSDSAEARKGFTIAHPLQPFAAEAFGRGDARRVTYQGQWQPADIGASTARTGLPKFAVGLPPRTPSARAGRISRDALYRGLSHPPREFLASRLGLRLPELADRLPDTEPFDRADGLHRHALALRSFDAAVAGEADDGDAFFQRLLAEGRVAPAAIGREEVQELLERLRPAVRAWRDWGDDAAVVLPYEIELEGFTLGGTLARVHAGGLRQYSASKGHGKTLLGLGLDVLVWSALGRSEPVRRLVEGEPPMVIAAVDSVEARARLQALHALFLEAGQDALPFMPKAGYEFFAAGGGAAGMKKARNSWTADHGEGKDPWVRLALRAVDPFEDDDVASRERFEHLSLAVFGLLPGLSPPAEDSPDE